MSIDDPISAIESLNESDERQKSPVLSRAEDFARATKVLMPELLGAATPLLEAGVAYLSKKAAQNRNELVAVLAKEAKSHAEKIGRLARESETHARFLRDEWPGLVLEAIRRAEEIRARDRIAALARIVVRAAELGPEDGADHVEEMMRIAEELGARDIRLLKTAVDADKAGPNRPVSDTKLDTRSNIIWLDIPWSQLGFDADEVESISSKLQGMGLLTGSQNLARQNTFRVLRRAHSFIDYVRSASSEAS